MKLTNNWLNKGISLGAAGTALVAGGAYGVIKTGSWLGLGLLTAGAVTYQVSKIKECDKCATISKGVSILGVGVLAVSSSPYASAALVSGAVMLSLAGFIITAGITCDSLHEVLVRSSDKLTDKLNRLDKQLKLRNVN